MLTVPTDPDTGQRITRWCLKYVGLRARALPPYDSHGGVYNISSGSGYNFIEKHPFTDSYYYLLLYTEGETDVTITITTKGKFTFINICDYYFKFHLLYLFILKLFSIRVVRL